MPEAIEQAITDIQFSRLAVLPPYSYDDDEGWRDPRGYLDFYRSAGQESVAAAEAYLRELRLLKESGEIAGRDMNSLFIARKRLVGSFPFCYDELDGMPQEQLELALRSMRQVYEKELSGNFLLAHLDQYIGNARRVSAYATSSSRRTL